jgi:2-dehydro-3-deoxyphosphogluconate aldolase/(4S)-4-hydroxy-2-oxoglutarate aldolase
VRNKKENTAMSRSPDRTEVLRIIEETGVVAVIRLASAEPLLRVAEAIAAGGVRVIEFTMTTPNALEVLAEVSAAPGASIFGAGTVLDAETARSAILAGARFIVSPVLCPDVVRLCRRYGVPVVPGAMTPTEILTAWELGADMVKVFPAGVLGPRYIKDILAPLPQLRLIPTGGVTLENAGEYIRAGAAAVGVGGDLLDARAIAEGRWQALTERAAALVQCVAEARK